MLMDCKNVKTMCIRAPTVLRTNTLFAYLWFHNELVEQFTTNRSEV